MISVLGQCSSCCTCPTATVEWDSVSATKEKCGFEEFDVSSPPKRYLTSTLSGSLTRDIYTNSWGGTLEYDPATCAVVSYYEWTDALGDTCAGGFEPGNSFTATCGGVPNTTVQFHTILVFCPDSSATEDFVLITPPATTATTRVWTGCNSTTSGTVTETLSDEYTNAMLRSLAEDDLPAYDSDWNDTAGSVSNLSTDELSIAIRESRYRLRFSIPTTNTGTNFRATWVERFIAEAGVGISSVSVHSAGVYRPTVTLSAPPTGGTQAYAIAVMSSTGTVSSIAILHPGYGYTSAPTVTVQAATGGGTSSTGWTATLTAGQVTAIGSGSAGDYRPTLAFTSGGGVGATATCTLDAVGGIAAVTVTAAGSAYTSEPTLTITPKVTGSTAADLLIHLGTETAKCTVWDGATPGGYAEGTPSTWPILPSAAPYYFELAVPTSDGTTLVANLRAVCDGTAC